MAEAPRETAGSAGGGGVRVMKADGTKELFDREKFIQSLRRAGAEASLADTIVAHIARELTNDMNTTDIYRHAFEVLRREHRHIAARYSLRRALVGFGPTGFPFEDYVAEIYRIRGFVVETGKMVRGKCVDHEVDLIAYDADELIMGEIKFHNEQGQKTDVKVALSVKARTDDLRASEFFYGGVRRTLSRSLILTNTKFTETAERYAACVGLDLISWNHPTKGNLQDLIEGAGLHPLSCLTSLSQNHKKELFDKGVVLCKALKENREILKDIGLNEEKIRDVEHEITMVC